LHSCSSQRICRPEWDLKGTETHFDLWVITQEPLPPLDSSMPTTTTFKSAPSPADGISVRAHRRLIPLAIAVPLFLAIAFGAIACGDKKEKVSITEISATEAEAEIKELIRLLTPLDPTLTSDHHDRHLKAQRIQQAKLEMEVAEFGRAALAAFHKNRDETASVRRGLLQVAARSAPEDTAPLLEKLVVEYGHPLDERAEATLLFGEAAPARALQVLEAMCRRTKRNETLPHDEFLIRGWVKACENLEISPVPVLVDNATNITKDSTSRHYAVKQLGKHVDPLGRQALEIVLIESTGNGYIRRMAAQSLRKTIPAEEACALFREVADRESENNFLRFLLDIIAETCP